MISPEMYVCLEQHSTAAICLSIGVAGSSFRTLLLGAPNCV